MEMNGMQWFSGEMGIPVFPEKFDNYSLPSIPLISGF